MRITIRQKDVEITDALREYIARKIVQPAERLLKRAGPDDMPILDIEIARTTRHHHKGTIYRASATLTLGKAILRAGAEDEDAHAACDAIEEELKREILTHKEKSRAMVKRGARKAKRESRYTEIARIPDGSRVREE